MEKTRVMVTEQDVNAYEGDLLVFCAAKRETGEFVADAKIIPLLDLYAQFEDFTAKENETVILYPADNKSAEQFAAKRLLIVGLGKYNVLDEQASAMEALRCAGGTLSKICAKLKVQDALIGPGPQCGLPQAQMAECLTEGIMLGDYQFVKYKKEDEENPVYPGLKKLLFYADEKVSTVRKAVKRGANVAKAVCAARDMANEPGNKWTATSFADYAEKLCNELPLTCKIIDKAKMKQIGLEGIIAVNQGSKEPPKLVILDYRPDKYKKTILLVGKGLTFDSGGISLKPSAGMQDMKYDMCGGAAVLAAMEAIAHEKLHVRVIGMIPATDNMSGSSALKPGDIVHHYNGTTSEIVNTDAEGRLILADALAYGVKQYEPDYAIDVATLTGAAIIGLGHHHSCILGNDDQLVDDLIAAGKKCAEPLWRLPLGKVYSKQIVSQVADIKNAGGRPAGTITAAAYLENFVGETPWAHIDIAGTAWEFTEKTYIPKGPSGIAVRTLVEFVRKF